MNVKPVAAWKLVFFLIMVSATALLFVACGVSPTGAPPETKVDPAALFASEAECTPCHAGIAHSHASSRHASSLRFIDRDTPSVQLPPAGQVGRTRYSVQRDRESLTFVNAASAEKRRKVDLAFGSGKSGVTYVALNSDNTLEEMRMSYVPRVKRWFVTPAQEDRVDEDLGRVHSVEGARACLGCHTSTIPAQTLRPEPRFLGIGCQACHGPAAAHVAAAKSGNLHDLKIDRASQWPSDRVIQACGKCHRTSANVNTTGNDVTMTQRFQAYGLEQSQCYQQSAGKLSCVTCHNPHTNVETNARQYEVICLQCHGGAPSERKAAFAVQSKVCPVNAERNCIGCHMPSRQVFTHSDIDVKMADHLITADRQSGHEAAP